MHAGYISVYGPFDASSQDSYSTAKIIQSDNPAPDYLIPDYLIELTLIFSGILVRVDFKWSVYRYTDLPRADWYARACMYRYTSMNYYGPFDLLSQVSGYSFCTGYI